MGREGSEWNRKEDEGIGEKGRVGCEWKRKEKEKK